MKYSRYVFFLLYYMFFGNISAQNLIRNGSFEEGECAQERRYSDTTCLYWYSIGNADYHSECSTGEVNPYHNFIGSQVPHSGKAYAGIFSGRDVKTHVAEILYTELSEPLIQGQTYRLSFWFSLADSSKFFNKAIGCAFSNTLAYKEMAIPGIGKGFQPLFTLTYNLKENDKVKLSNSKDWVLFEREFVAKGGERYLYLSSVEEGQVSCIERNAQDKPIRDLYESAYYYIDDVSLVKRNPDSTYPDILSQPDPRKLK